MLRREVLVMILNATLRHEQYAYILAIEVSIVLQILYLNDFFLQKTTYLSLTVCLYVIELMK